MRKLFVGMLLVLGMAFAVSFALYAQNQGAAANGNGGGQAARKETVPWNKPEEPRAPNPNAAAAARPGRPGVFFREDFKAPAKNTYADPCCMQFSQDSVTNANLELKYYGAGKDMTLVGTTGDEANPLHMWSGLCPSACAMTLRDKTNYVDLSRGKIKWIYKTTGFHVSRPVIKLADGTLLIGDHADYVDNGDWRVSEFYPAEIRWLPMDPDRASGWGNWVAKPDLTKVDEVGWVDLMAGSGHNGGGYVDIANFEVDGKPVPRGTQSTQLNN